MFLRFYHSSTNFLCLQLLGFIRHNEIFIMLIDLSTTRKIQIEEIRETSFRIQNRMLKCEFACLYQLQSQNIMMNADMVLIHILNKDKKPYVTISTIDLYSIYRRISLNHVNKIEKLLK